MRLFLPGKRSLQAMQTHRRSQTRPPFRQVTRKQSRRGSATVECAVCLPAFLMIVFGSIEASNALYLKQTLAIGAYEAGMTLSRTNGLAVQAEIRCQEVLEARGLTSFELEFTPKDTVNIERGETFTVQVRASMEEFSLGSLWHYHNATLSETIHMTKL